MDNSSKNSMFILNKEVSFPGKIIKTIDFENTIVVQINPKLAKTIGDLFQIHSIYGVSKVDGEIIWSRPGFEISKQKKESKILLLSPKNSQPINYELQIYCVSMNFYVNPDSGKTIRQEQTK